MIPREITETLLSGRTVILNLEGMDLEIAQRIIDFVSGADVCNQRKPAEDFKLHIPCYTYKCRYFRRSSGSAGRIHGDSKRKGRILISYAENQSGKRYAVSGKTFS